jgi:hypothetical protein
VTKAPPEIVAKERKKLEDATALKEKLEAQLGALGD